MKDRGVVCELGVTDVARSIAFYQKLGFAIVATERADGSISWAELSFHGSRLMLQAIGDLAGHLPGIAREPAMPSHAVVLRVGSAGDAEALHRRLNELAIGGQSGLRQTHYGTTEFSVADPDGYILLIAGFSNSPG